jgi:hypothetical protein
MPLRDVLSAAGAPSEIPRDLEHSPRLFISVQLELSPQPPTVEQTQLSEQNDRICV